jgi:hypothetical protein
VSLALLPNRLGTAEKGLERVKVYNSDGGPQAAIPTVGKRGLLKICERPEQCQGGISMWRPARMDDLHPDTTENLFRVFSGKEGPMREPTGVPAAGSSSAVSMR